MSSSSEKAENGVLSSTSQTRALTALNSFQPLAPSLDGFEAPQRMLVPDIPPPTQNPLTRDLFWLLDL
jgi:hypothetical protein